MPIFPDASIGDQWSAGEVTSVMLHANIDDPLDLLAARVQDIAGWQTPTLGASWVAYTGGTSPIAPQYRLKGGIVYFKGSMKSGVQTTTVFTLPAGMRPVGDEFFMCYATSGAVEVAIFNTGAVAVGTYVGSGANTQVALDTVSFIAEH